MTTLLVAVVGTDAENSLHNSKRLTVETIERSPEEVAEIERHKYFLSEKAGHDVGWEHAADDWEANHAEAFRYTDAEQRPNGKGISMLFKRIFSRS